MKDIALVGIHDLGAAVCDSPVSQTCVMRVYIKIQKKAPRIFQRSAFVACKTPLINFDKLRIAGANHSLRVCETVHINRYPATVHEHKVRISDQPEMVRPIPLNEELFRVPSKTEHFAVPRSEFILVHGGRLIRVHVPLARARTYPSLTPIYPSLSPVYVPSLTLNIGLSAHICARVRLGL